MTRCELPLERALRQVPVQAQPEGFVGFRCMSYGHRVLLSHWQTRLYVKRLMPIFR